MIIRIEDIQQSCADIVGAVDSNELSTLTETLELKVENQALYMGVTNREYYAQVKMALGEDVDLHATVNATTFLKLISQITTETVELTTTDNSLIVKGNGTYKLPLIFDNDKLLELPKIPVNNVTASFDISRDILMSIYNYNTKELQKGTAVKPVQKLYYVDQNGCITFTNGACVNKFTLPQPVKILLNGRLVKLFKLFKEDKIAFELGHEAITDEIIQTRVSFKTPTIEISAILSCDDSMINSVPSTAIRGRADETYPYSINMNKNALVQAINRLSLFGKDAARPYSLFEFNTDYVTIYDASQENKEIVYYNNDTSNVEEVYSTYLDFNDLKLTLDNCVESYVTINYGNKSAIVISRGNVRNVIAECRA